MNQPATKPAAALPLLQKQVAAFTAALGLSLAVTALLIDGFYSVRYRAGDGHAIHTEGSTSPRTALLRYEKAVRGDLMYDL